MREVALPLTICNTQEHARVDPVVKGGDTGEPTLRSGEQKNKHHPCTPPTAIWNEDSTYIMSGQNRTGPDEVNVGDLDLRYETREQEN